MIYTTAWIDVSIKMIDDQYYTNKSGLSTYPNNKSNNSKRPMLIGLMSDMYMISGIILLLLTALAFSPVFLVLGISSLILGYGLRKGIRMMWLITILFSVTGAVTAAYVCMMTSMIPLIGILMMPFGIAGMAFNIFALIYMLLPNVRSYFLH